MEHLVDKQTFINTINKLKNDGYKFYSAYSESKPVELNIINDTIEVKKDGESKIWNINEFKGLYVIEDTEIQFGGKYCNGYDYRGGCYWMIWRAYSLEAIKTYIEINGNTEGIGNFQEFKSIEQACKRYEWDRQEYIDNAPTIPFNGGILVGPSNYSIWE